MVDDRHDVVAEHDHVDVFHRGDGLAHPVHRRPGEAGPLGRRDDRRRRAGPHVCGHCRSTIRGRAPLAGQRAVDLELVERKRPAAEVRQGRQQQVADCRRGEGHELVLANLLQRSAGNERHLPRLRRHLRPPYLELLHPVLFVAIRMGVQDDPVDHVGPVAAEGEDHVRVSIRIRVRAPAFRGVVAPVYQRRHRPDAGRVLAGEGDDPPAVAGRGDVVDDGLVGRDRLNSAGRLAIDLKLVERHPLRAAIMGVDHQRHVAGRRRVEVEGLVDPHVIQPERANHLHLIDVAAGLRGVDVEFLDPGVAILGQPGIQHDPVDGPGPVAGQPEDDRLREARRLARPPLAQIELVAIDQVAGRVRCQLVRRRDDVAAIIGRDQVDRAGRFLGRWRRDRL